MINDVRKKFYDTGTSFVQLKQGVNWKEKSKENNSSISPTFLLRKSEQLMDL